MDLDLKDRTVLVTGGAKGIGEAVTRALAAEGALPVVVDRDREAGEALRAELDPSGARSGLVIADLTEPGACRRAVEATLAVTGRLDALVNNAGVNDRVSLEEGTVEDFVTSLRRNLIHYFEIAHYALPALKEARGTIVNVASKVAVTGQGGTSGYAASKGGILALTREWAVDLAPSGIRVNAVVPAEVMTPLYRQWLGTFAAPEEKLADIVRRIPLERRMTTPEEIAAAVLFLLSPRSGHTTGQYLFPDGGYVHLDRAIT
jgi:L-fucose dehydrogenase